MSIHVCKQCGSRFEYCRACVFRPIRYKDNGFCSKECYEASKKVVEPVAELEPIVEEIAIVEIEEPVVENNSESSTEDIQPIEEEVFAEAEVSVEVPTIETTVVVEPTIKKETNTYKKKKNKYQVHE